ncbi:FliM/FliN family flagellar motor switch protein [Candidatus Margulisiibacteriota bacterium]
MNEEIIFKRAIKLPAAIGDWTKLKAEASDEKKVRPGLFIFDRLGEPELKKIHLLHYKLGEQLIASLTRELKIKLILRSVVAEQLNYKSFLSKISGDYIQADIHLEENQRFFIVYELPMIEMLMDRVLGGDGTGEHLDTLSDLDKETIQTIISRQLTPLSNLWGIAEDTFAPNLHFPAPVPDNAIAAKDGVVAITLELGIGDKIVQKIILMYSNKILRQLLGRMPVEPARETVELNEKTRHSIMVPVRVELGETELLMADLRKLDAGDVIQLDKLLGETINIIYGDTVNLHGQLGLHNESLAVQVLSRNIIPQTSLPARIETPAPEPAIIEEPIVEEELSIPVTDEPVVPESQVMEEPEIVETMEEDEDEEDIFDEEETEEFEDEEEIIAEEPEEKPVKAAVEEPEEDDDDDIFSGLDLEDDDDDEFSWDEDEDDENLTEKEDDSDAGGEDEEKDD